MSFYWLLMVENIASRISLKEWVKVPDYGCICSLDKRAINHFPPLLVNLFGDVLYLSYYFLNFACRIYFRLVYHNSNACQKVSVLFFVTKTTHFLATTMRFSRLKSNEFDWFPIIASQFFISRSTPLSTKEEERCGSIYLSLKNSYQINSSSVAW